MSEAAIWKDGRVYLEMDDDDLEAFELFMALALANKLPNARISIYQAASFDAWHWEAVRFLHRQGRGGFLGAKREAEELRQHMATHPDDEAYAGQIEDWLRLGAGEYHGASGLIARLQRIAARGGCAETPRPVAVAGRSSTKTVPASEPPPPVAA